MRIQVNPNRMELLKLRKRLVLARRGHKLLKDKQEELMKHLLVLMEENQRLRREVEAKLREGYTSMAWARGAIFKEMLEEAVLYPKQKVDLELSTIPVMNLRLPKLKFEQRGEVDCYGFVETSADLDRALSIISGALPSMIRLAEIERSVELLADEIEKTRRRVNALEYILIPNLEETIRYISMKLSEMERATTVRLMKVKELVGR